MRNTGADDDAATSASLAAYLRPLTDNLNARGVLRVLGCGAARLLGCKLTYICAQTAADTST